MTKRKTPLYELHQQAHATIVDFFGWQMPLHYGSQIEEHHHVRRDAGMFDVSHMTVVDLLGTGGRQLLRNLLTNDIDRLPHPGSALYTCMLNHEGGIIDDLIVYFRAPDNYRLVLNAATREKDLDWIQQQSVGFSVGIQERRELAMIAVQGPQAIAKAYSVFTPAQVDVTSTLHPFEAVDIDHWFIARTGYTGEEGLEIILPAEDAKKLWQVLLEKGVHPCGLGARDSLRLEAGMMLYGQDMDESTTPYESGLTWVVASMPERDFIGRAALQLQKEQGIKKKFVGLKLLDKGVMRAKQKVVDANNVEGIITSGGFSPTLNASIAFARVPKEMKDEGFVIIRDQKIPVKTGKPRFVRHGKIIWES